MVTYVYFIQNGKHGSIKIGVAANIEQRICEMQTGNPFELRLIASMEFSSRKQAIGVETVLHKKFRRHHVRGEWFSPKINLGSISAACKRGGHKISELIEHEVIYESANDKIKRLEREIRRLKGRVEDLNDENEELMEVINSKY
jgi:predicted GIY-YIG superfamily endonuclease